MAGEVAGAAQGPDGSSPVDFLGLHRYPDPHQVPLKRRWCALRTTHAHTSKDLGPENLFVGVGSDEAIDTLLRCFCVPGRDRIVVCPPTYGMYAVAAQVNDVALVRVPLRPPPEFGLDVAGIAAALTREPDVKLVYVTSPGNPTGGLLAKADVRALLEHPTWNGIVVVDEAYIDFSPDEAASLAEWVLEWPNLVVLQTLSKAFGMAGIRLGAAFAAAPVARLLNSMKPPYNVSSPTSQLALRALSDAGVARMHAHRDQLLAQRDRLVAALPRIPGIGALPGGRDGNFLLFEVLNTRGEPDNVAALKVYQRLAETKQVVVRFRGKEPGCLGCLRITLGTEDEVTHLLAALEGILAAVHAESSVPADEEAREVEASAVVA